MALMMAKENCFVTVAGVSVYVHQGDLYDSLQAVVVACPSQFVALPAGTPAAHGNPVHP